MAVEVNLSPKDRENYMIRNFTIFILGHMCLEKDEIGWTNGTEGEGETHTEFGWENLKERVH